MTGIVAPNFPIHPAKDSPEGDASTSTSDNLKTEDSTSASQDVSSTSTSVKPAASAASAVSALEKDAAAEEKQKAMQATHVTAYSVTECRSLVKTLVCGVKTITWGIASCRYVDNKRE